MNDDNDLPLPVPQFPIAGTPTPPMPPTSSMPSSPSDDADSADDGVGAMQATAALGNERNPNDQMWWPADDDHVSTRRKSNPKTWILAGAGTVAIAAASIVGINAASSHSTSIGGATPQAGQFGGGPGGVGGGPGQSGTIAAVDGTTLTLTKSAGSTTKVTTSTATAVTLTTTGTATDLAVGDHIVVTGAAANGTIAAQRIVDSGAVASAFGGGPGPGLGGLGGGQRAPANGAQPANATGAAGSGQSGTASAAGQPPQGAPAGQGAPGGFIVGTIASIDGSSMTITANDATTANVTITATTQVIIQRTGSLADIAVGAQVTINGTTASTGEIAATAIRVAATS